MIHNVIGKAVTKSTVIGLPGYDGKREISDEDLARVALALKNSQGKGKDEEEALSHVERLRDACAHEQSRFTLGWIYNASGGAITLVNSRDWRGELASSSLYPVRIENGQWGVFLHEQSLSVSSGAVVYQFVNCYSKRYRWCVAWKNQATSSGKVHVKIGEGYKDWCETEWNNVEEALEISGSVHRTSGRGWSSVISASPAPLVVFEALLTLEDL